MELIQIDRSKCAGCGMCILSCPYKALYQEEKSKTPRFIPEIGCIRCGHCVAVCPKQAITHTGIDATRIKEIEKYVSGSDIEMFLMSKRSIRNFLDKPVERETIERLITVACQAPTDANSQDRGFIVINSREKVLHLEAAIIDGFKQFITTMVKKGAAEDTKEIKRSRAVIAYYEQGGHPIFRGAPSVIFIYGAKHNPFSWYNCSLASDYLMLMAHSIGIGSCVIGMALYETESLGKYLAIPENNRIYSCITLGYPKLKYKKTVERNKADIIWL